MPNEVKIIVKAESKVKEGFDKVDKEATLAGDKAGQSYLTAFGKRLQTLGTALSTQVRQSGQKIGQDMGDRIGDQVEKKVTESVRRSRDRAKPSSDAAGKGIGQDIGDALTEPIAQKVKGALYVSRSRSQGTATETGHSLGQDIGDAITEPITQKVRESVRRSGAESVGAARSAGADIGSEMGDRAGTRLVERIRMALRRRFHGDATVDVDTKGGGLPKLGGDSKSIGDGLLGGLSLGMVGKVALAALVPALAPGLAALITSALLTSLGGGVLAAGIAGALRDPMFKGNDPKHPFKTGAIADLKKRFGELVTEFGKPFRSPVADFLEKLVHFVDSLIPKMRKLADSMAPILGELGTGLIGMLQNLMPGILKAVEASKPLLETLAKHMPEIGRAIGKFFGIISEQGDDANLAFSDMLKSIEVIIPTIGQLIAWLTSAYSTVRRITKNGVERFGEMARAVTDFATKAKGALLNFALFVLDRVYAPLLIAAAEAFGWIPGIGPKLQRAQNAFTNFRNKVNNELNKIHDKTVTIKIRQVFTTIGHAVTDAAGLIASRMADGGIKGAATGAISGGWTWVGERGPELAKLPPGTSVRTAGDSARMASNQPGPGWIMRVDVNPMLDQTMVGALLKALRLTISNQGGNVQAVLGSGY